MGSQMRSSFNNAGKLGGMQGRKPRNAYSQVFSNNRPGTPSPQQNRTGNPSLRR